MFQYRERLLLIGIGPWYRGDHLEGKGGRDEAGGTRASPELGLPRFQARFGHERLQNLNVRSVSEAVFEREILQDLQI